VNYSPPAAGGMKIQFFKFTLIKNTMLTKIELFKTNVFIVLLFLVIHVDAEKPTVDLGIIQEFEFNRVEIIDSSICIVLDSILDFEKYCTKRKSRFITYYYLSSVVTQFENGDVGFTIEAELDNFNCMFCDSSDIPGILIYRGRYFIIRDLDEIIGLDRYLRLTNEFEIVQIRELKLLNMGKTYPASRVIISQSSIYIDECACMCYYGSLSQNSATLGIRKLFYDLFCPCRGISAM